MQVSRFHSFKIIIIITACLNAQLAANLSFELARTDEFEESKKEREWNKFALIRSNESLIHSLAH